MRRLWIAPALVAALIGVYAVAGFVVVPRVAKSAAQDYVAKELGRKLAIGAIRFNPFTLEAVIDDLQLREADDAPIAGFKSLRVNAELASIWARGVVLKDVRLDDPVVRVVIAPDGSVNLAQLAPKSADAKPASTEPQPPPRVRIGTLAVENGRVDFEDRSQYPKPFEAVVEKIHFGLTDFRVDLDYKNAFAFAATTAHDEQFELTGTFTVQPLGSAGKVSIRNLRAQTIDDYLQAQLPFKLASGTATLAADYQLAVTPTLGVEVAVPSVAVRDVQLQERASNAKETPLAVAQLDLNGLAYSYARSELAVKELALAGVRVDVERAKDGSINLTRLFTPAPATAPSAPAAPAKPAKPAKPADPAAPTKPAGNPFKVRIDTIRLADSAVRVVDQAVTPPVRLDLKPIAATVTGWSTDAAARFGVEGDVTLNTAGRLQVKGDLQLEPLATQLDVTLRDLALPFLQPYLTPYTTMALHSARLGVAAKVAYAAGKDGTPSIGFKGNVDLADLRTSVPPATEDLLKWKALNIAAIDYVSAPARLSIDRVTLTQPFAKVVIAADRTINVTQVIREQPGEAKRAPATKDTKTAKPASAGAPFPIRVRQIRIADGTLDFADLSIQPQFAAGIVALAGSIDGLSSEPASRAKVALAGKVDKYAPVEITGDLNALAATKYTDLALAFRNMDLTTFNPYSGKFAGYNISKGKLTTELRYKIADRALQAEHHVVIDNLEFGEKTDSKDAAPIPVKLAVALLKDRKGVIDLELPVRGSLDDPEFKLGPLVWKVVLNVLTKIVTAPFAAIGSLFGGGEELAFVDFAPGAVVVPPEQKSKLDKLATALVERPQLRLDVPHTVAERDADALARAALDQRVPPGAAAADPNASKRIRVAQLEGVYKQVAKNAFVYPPELKPDDTDARLRAVETAVLEKLKPDRAALDTLARQRAQAVQDLLLARKEVDPQRVFLSTDRKAGTTPAGTVRMEMKLE